MQHECMQSLHAKWSFNCELNASAYVFFFFSVVQFSFVRIDCTEDVRDEWIVAISTSFFRRYPMDIQVCPIHIESCKYHRSFSHVIDSVSWANFVSGSVSYPNQKVRLAWDDKSGVVLNPELKLLQYNLGQPLELSSSHSYMPEKHGRNE